MCTSAKNAIKRPSFFPYKRTHALTTTPQLRNHLSTPSIITHFHFSTIASTIQLRAHPSWKKYNRLLLIPSSTTTTTTTTIYPMVMTKGLAAWMTHQTTSGAARMTVARTKTRTPHALPSLCRQPHHGQSGLLFSRTLGSTSATSTMFGASKRGTATDSGFAGSFAVSVQCPPGPGGRGGSSRRVGVRLHTQASLPGATVSAAPPSATAAIQTQQHQQHHYSQLQQQRSQQQAGMFFMSSPPMMTRQTDCGPGRRGVHQQMSTQQELDNVVSFYDDQVTLVSPSFSSWGSCLSHAMSNIKHALRLMFREAMFVKGLVRFR